MARKKKVVAKQEQEVLLVTEDGYKEMTSELEYRTGELRTQIANEINEARNLGDLSENQAYTEAIERKNMNEARIEELEAMVTIAQIIQKDTTGTVGVGDTVDILNTRTNTKRTITLVGKGISQEADPREGKISIDSPLGKALKGSKKGDVIKVELPIGISEYKITSVAA
jgi:transcription elongation factor GreA